MPSRISRGAGRLADRVSEEIALRVSDRLVGRGVRVVSPAPWFSAGDGERERVDHHAMVVLLAALLAEGDTFIDVGAHEGHLLEHAVRIAPHGAHVAWEPLPHLAADLRTHFPSVEIRNAALGDETGIADFLHIVDSPGQSGFRDRDFPETTARETIRVAVERLDDALERGTAPVVIKVDVEGAELAVFRGGLETITRHRPCILFEHMIGGAEYYGTRSEDVWDLLCEECQLTIFDLDGAGPYSRDQFADAVGLRARWNWLARP